jgi:hypothetical protein
MTDAELRDFKRLNSKQVDLFESRQAAYDRILLRAYKSAYDETVAQMATLYAKVGLASPVDGVSIRKEDAIRYRQLQNRLDNVADEMEKLRRIGVRLTEEDSAQSIQDAYYGGQWALEQGSGTRIKYPALPVSVIRASVYSDASGLTFVQTWAKNTADSIYRTQAAITRGITLGHSYTKMAQSIKGEFDKGLWQAMRVVRTEAGRNWSVGAEASHQAAADLGLEVRKRWSAALDMRTRTSHARLDGTYADDDGLFHIGGLSAEQPRLFGDPEQDINCRCSAYDVLPDSEPTMRRIRGLEGDDKYTAEKAASRIVPYQTFEQWAKPQGWSAETGWPRKNISSPTPVKNKPEVEVFKQKATFNRKTITANGESINVPSGAKEVIASDYYTEKFSESMGKRYDDGKRFRQAYKDYGLQAAMTEDIYKEEPILDWEIYGNEMAPESDEFFKSGYYGISKPSLNVGWRFGDAPESGRSRNFAEDRSERGVSFMQTGGEDKLEGMYELMNSGGNKRIRWYVGLQLEARGADGEALMVAVRELK